MQPYGKGPSRKLTRQAQDREPRFRVREHKDWGLGLRPGITGDTNCAACRREDGAGQRPLITVEGVKR